MNKIKLVIIAFFITLCLTGCGNRKIVELENNISKLELMNNLITYRAYYNNVVNYSKPKENILVRNRELFIEYTGTIDFGIDLSKVKINVKGSKINVFIPKAKVIGEPNIDIDNFKVENFIESKAGLLNLNKLTADDSILAFENAQKKLKDDAESDETLLQLAQTRPKIIIEENIKELGNLKDDEYQINWEYE